MAANDVDIIGSRAIVEEGFVCKEETHLTVLKKSLFFAGDGFTAYDDKGRVAFRVDSYGGNGSTGELVLMDPKGRCILTVRRKRMSLHHRWEGFTGERTGFEDKPIFSVRRASMMIGRLRMTVETYNNQCIEYYHVEGSFATRKCVVFDGHGKLVAEIRRKVDSHSKVMLGKDAFSVSLKPGFDGAFALGLVLILDQVHGTTRDRLESSCDVSSLYDSC